MPETDKFAPFATDAEIESFVGEVGSALAELGTNLQVADIFAGVMAEFWRARELHGDQTDRPLGTGPDRGYLNELDDFLPGDSHDELAGPAWSEHFGMDNVSTANAARKLCQAAFETPGGDTWAKICGEEFFEMLAESDPEKVETEATQTIAMLVNLILAARKVASQVA